MGKTDRAKRTITRRPTRVGLTTQLIKTGRQYLIEGELDLSPSITVYLISIREVRTWLGSDIPVSQGLIYRAGADSEIRTRGKIGDFDEAEEVLRAAAFRLLAVPEGKAIRVRRAIWQTAMAAGLAGTLFLAGVAGAVHPVTRPHVLNALAWVGAQIIERVKANPPVKLANKQHQAKR
jgi:hypothetical protein